MSTILKLTSAFLVLFFADIFGCSDDYLPAYSETETLIFSKDSFVVSGTGVINGSLTDTLFLNPEFDSIKVSFSISSDIDSLQTSTYGASVIVKDYLTSYLLKTFNTIPALNSSYEFYTKLSNQSLVTIRFSGGFNSSQQSNIKFKNIRVIKYLQ